ncbi:MAG: gatB [Ignavibacteria bacterium]|nr:gatB [Ignavibacteria bacterium]
MYDFVFKPFGEMTPEDYEEIGFMSGLEIHQQLLTKKKLFCHCPAGRYTHSYNAEILRHMRPTLSELGEYDGTALMEFKTKKNIIYRIHRDTVCTYEMDDTPPFLINEDALDIAFEVALLLDASIVDEIHIARKQYLDGSIPTGFQRTAITCVNGKIPYKDRVINIIQMSIEEDSCREEGDSGHNRIYLTDRLGMPLIETVTAPEMKTPQEVAEVNELLRRLSRSTGHVRTGIGAGREDVNVSVRGGTRIEIKGVPQIHRIPLLTYNEAMRQWNLLRLREELHRRGITQETFEAKVDDVTFLLRKTVYQPLFKAIESGKLVKCVTLRGFKGLLTWQTQTDTYFAKEISDRVRVIACLTELPNIIHSDSYENTLSSAEGQKLRKTVGTHDDDSLVLVWGDKADAEMAANEIIIRAKEATLGVPSETRQALRDGTNGFERILPGPDRMYPDTDLPPKRITPERINKIKQSIPEKYWLREKWYQSLKLSDDISKPLAISPFADLFKLVVNEWKVNPITASNFIIQFPKRLKRLRLNTSILTIDVMKSLFDEYRNGNITKDSMLFVMQDVCRMGKFEPEYLPEKATPEEVEAAIDAALLNVNDLEIKIMGKFEHIISGYAMKNLRGRAAAADVMTIIKKKIGKEK